ncbi:MAG: papain-like cysteine protease family protein [Phycisphaerae bacterium]
MLIAIVGLFVGIYVLSRPGGDSGGGGDKGGSKTASTASAPSTNAVAGDPLGYSRLPVDWTTSQAISASAGGQVVAADGTRIDFPPGALSADRTVNVRRLKAVGPGEPSVILDVDAGPGALAKPAVVTVTAPKDDKIPGDRRRYVAMHVHDGKRTSLGPVTYDEKTGTARVEVKQFSIVHVVLLTAAGAAAAWETMFAKGSENLVSDRTLGVPFYPQGGAGWCWAASATMLQKHYGRDVETWDTAALFRAPFDQGFSGGNILSRTFTTLITPDQPMYVEATLLGFFSSEGVTRYALAQVAQGRPVWVAMPNVSHVMVIVGSDSRGIVVHDPSGEILDRIAGRAKGSGGDAVERKLCNAHLTWDQWYAILFDPASMSWGGAAGGVVTPVAHTLVVRGADDRTSAPLSITIHDKHLEFHHPDYAPGGNQSLVNQFVWDGTVEGGFKFAGVAPILQGLPFSGPTNSDRLGKLTVSVANVGKTQIDGACLRVLLDGQQVRTDTLDVPAGSTNVPIDLMGPGPIDFRKAPLTVGRHTLRVAIDQGGPPVDTITLTFDVGPSRPERIKAQRVAENKVKIEWDKCPEKGLKYVIWRDRQVVGNADAPPYEAEDDGKKHDWSVEAVFTDGQPLSMTNVSTYPAPSSHLSDRVSVSAKSQPVALEYLNVRYKDTIDAQSKPMRIIYGEAKNVGQTGLNNPLIQLKGVVWKAGDPPSRTGLAGDMVRLPVGMQAPFRMLAKAGGPAEFEFELTNIFPDDKPFPNKPLEFIETHVGVAWPSPDKPNDLVKIEVDGQLKNSSPDPTEGDTERIVATFYDAAGKVVGVGWTHGYTHEKSIAPGKPGTRFGLRTQLIADSFAAYRLTATAGEKHYTTVYRKTGNVSLSLRQVSADPPKIEITNKGELPVWPCWAEMARSGAYQQEDGSAVGAGKSRVLSDPFAKKRAPGPACWFPHAAK